MIITVTLPNMSHTGKVLLPHITRKYVTCDPVQLERLQFNVTRVLIYIGRTQSKKVLIQYTSCQVGYRMYYPMHVQYTFPKSTCCGVKY